MLTKQQRKLLTFIDTHLKENDGVSPSFDEMKDAMGLKSKSGIHRLITGLEERGHIRRFPHRARAIQVLITEEFGEKFIHQTDLGSITSFDTATRTVTLELKSHENFANLVNTLPIKEKEKLPEAA